MKHRFIVFSVILLFFQFISCNDELVVDQKEQTNPGENPALSKVGNLLSIQKDSISQKERKERVLNLKKEHEKPYVVIEKPEKLLAEKLNLRISNKSIYQSPTNSKLNSVQGTQSCYTLEIDVWALEKYHSKSGFNVGICPKNTWMYNASILTILKNYWAFNLVMLERMAFANPIVYPDNQIVAGIEFQSPQLVLNSYIGFLSEPGRQQLFGFYGDEPWHFIVIGLRDSIAKTINNLKNIAGFANSKYIGGETCDGWADNFDDLVDYINQTTYTDMTYWWSYGCFPGPWDEQDQRDEWTDFNYMFGSKFNHLWISGVSDRGEMDLLTGHAQNMGKNSIWLYAGEPNIPDQNYWDAISEFNYYAFIHNYLRREERRYIYVYNYIGFEDPCYDYQITSWEIVDIINTGETIIR